MVCVLLIFYFQPKIWCLMQKCHASLFCPSLPYISSTDSFMVGSHFMFKTSKVHSCLGRLALLISVIVKGPRFNA